MNKSILLLAFIASLSWATANDEELVKKANDYRVVLNEPRELERLRQLCFGDGVGQDDDLLQLRALWGLVRYEFSFMVIEAASAKRAAAWRVRKSCEKFHRFCVEKGFHLQEQWSLRLLVAQSYRTEALELLGEKLDYEAARSLVAARLRQVFSPASSHLANRTVQTAFRNTVKDAQEASSKANVAYAQAIAALKKTYGIDPQQVKSDCRPHFSDREQRAFYGGLFEKVEEMLAEERDNHREESLPAQDLPVLRRYGELRRMLFAESERASIPEISSIRDGKAPTLLEEIFGNDARKIELKEIAKIIEQKFEVDLPCDLEELENWFPQADQDDSTEKRVARQLDLLHEKYQRLLNDMDRSTSEGDLDPWRTWYQALRNFLARRSLTAEYISLKEYIAEEFTRQGGKE